MIEHSLVGAHALGRRDVVVARLREEILLYLADAIEVILNHGDYASQELRDLERQALGIEFYAPYWVLPSIGNATSGPTRFTGLRLECPDATLDALLASDLLDGCLDPVIHWRGHVVANVGSWVSLVRSVAYEIRSGAPAARSACLGAAIIRNSLAIDLAGGALAEAPEPGPSRAAAA